MKRHILLCHQGSGKCIQNWDFPLRHSPPQRTRQTASATSNRERNFHDEGTAADDVEPDYVKIQTEEFYKELGRIAARDHMNQIKRETFNYPSPQYADKMSAGIPPNSYAEDANEIFGFRGYACDNCLSVTTLRVRFGKGVGERGVARREDAHSCDPARVVPNRESSHGTRGNSVLHNRVPHLLKERVSNWTENNPFLVAIRLGNPVEENLTLFSSRPMENNVITFQYSREKHIDITLTAHNFENYRHILRAIKSGKTPLDDWELTNIIEMMKGVTFGTITIYYEGTPVGLNKASQQRRAHHNSESYFVYITSYSALDNVKERWQHGPLADFIASIKSDVPLADFIASIKSDGLYPGPFS